MGSDSCQTEYIDLIGTEISERQELLTETAHLSDNPSLLMRASYKNRLKELQIELDRLEKDNEKRKYH